MYDDNIDLDYNAIYVWYATVPVSSTISTIEGGGSSAVTTINTDTGGPVTGPVITLTGGSTGYTFAATGTTISLAGVVSGGVSIGLVQMIRQTNYQM